MAYYFLFAVFPFFLFLTTVIGYLPIPHLLDYVLSSAARMLPSGQPALHGRANRLYSLLVGTRSTT